MDYAGHTCAPTALNEGPLRSGTLHTTRSGDVPVEEISTAEDFNSIVQMPLTAAGEEFSFPVSAVHVKALYCRLRDDPSAVAIVPLP